MEILAVTYSERVSQLYERLKQLARSDVVFDNCMENATPYWRSHGMYRGGEKPPRISLEVGASEETVVHELLHGILDYTGYPKWNNRLSEYWELATAAANVVCQHTQHIIIGIRMSRLGYDVTKGKCADAQQGILTVQEWGKQAMNEVTEDWRSLLVAERFAYYGAEPGVPSNILQDFRTEMQTWFPKATTLSGEFATQTSTITKAARQEVRAAIWAVLDGIQRRLGGAEHSLSELRRKVIVWPVYVTGSQMRADASQSIAVDDKPATCSKHPRLSHIIWLRSVSDKTPVCMAFCEGNQDFERTLNDFRRHLRRRLSRFLSHYKIPFWEVR